MEMQGSGNLYSIEGYMFCWIAERIACIGILQLCHSANIACGQPYHIVLLFTPHGINGTDFLLLFSFGIIHHHPGF